MTVETKYECTVPLPWAGRSLKLFSITIKKERIMAAEAKLVAIKITNAAGIAYAKGKVYMVTEAEAKNLISNQKAIAVTVPAENATAKTDAEKRG